CREWSSFGKTSNTSSMGASKSRLTTTSRSLGNSTTADRWCSGIVGLLSLELLEVVVHAVQAGVHRPLVLCQPVVQRPQAGGLEAVQPAASVRAARDQPHLAEHPQVLRDLGLRHRDVDHDRADSLLTGAQCIEDVGA